LADTIEQANAVLDRAAQRQLLWGGLLYLMLALLIAVRWSEAREMRLNPGLLAVFALLVVLVAAVCGAGYRELRSFRFTTEGILPRSPSGIGVVPWEAVEEIQLARGGFRIRVKGGRIFKANLQLAGNTQPLSDLLRDRANSRVRLII